MSSLKLSAKWYSLMYSSTHPYFLLVPPILHRIYHPNDARWRVQTLKLLIVQFTHLLSYLINSIALSSSWGANARAVSEQIFRPVWSPRIEWRIYKRSPLVPALNQINPIHTRFILVVSSHLYLRLPIGLSCTHFPTKILNAFRVSCGLLAAAIQLGPKVRRHLLKRLKNTRSLLVFEKQEIAVCGRWSV
jgi:hypothetical protein